jgi:hypothetical protein
MVGWLDGWMVGWMDRGNRNHVAFAVCSHFAPSVSHAPSPLILSRVLSHAIEHIPLPLRVLVLCNNMYRQCLCVMMCFALLIGPGLMIGGVYYMVDSQNHHRAHLIDEYNMAVQNWNSYGYNNLVKSGCVVWCWYCCGCCCCVCVGAMSIYGGGGCSG